MKKPRIAALPLVVVVAVVALVVGTFGTAQAAGLTAGKVKRIAAKVVDRKASSLSVAHAATADTATNATQLNGQPASSYQNPSYRFSLPQGGTAASTHVYNFPGVPAGTYLVNFTLLTSAATNTNVACYMSPTATSSAGRFFGMGTYANGLSTPTGTGILTLTSASSQLYCYALGAGGNWTIYNSADFPSWVTFTRVDSVSSLTSARPSSEARPAPGTN